MVELALLVTAGLVVGTWLSWSVGLPRTVHGAGGAERRVGDGLDHAAAHDTVRRTSIIVPARNEARSLPALLGTLPPGRADVEVIVVDDGSEDDTAAVAAAAGATVVTAGDPPSGWTGKAWACQRGASAAEGDVLIFLDADTWLGAGALDRIVATHRAVAADGLLSLQPRHEPGSFVEHLSAVGNVASLMASGIGRPDGSGRSSIAFGPCMVTSAAAYDAIGGHASVHDRVLDDVALAARYRDAGRPVEVGIGVGAGGREILSFRMFRGGFREMAQAATRTLAAGGMRTPPLPTLGAFLWVLAGLRVALAAGMAIAGVGGAPVIEVVAVWVAFSLHGAWILRRLGRFAPWVVPVFPLLIVAFSVFALRSLAFLLFRRPVPWRGRHLPAPRS